MTQHIRRLLVAALISVVTAAVGIAQPNAEKSPATTAPSQPTFVASDGVLVAAVEAGSPAEKTGIARGDIVLTVNGTAVNTPRAIRQALDGKKAGDSLTVKFRHGDAEKTATLALGALNGRPWIGLILVPSGFGTGMGMGGDFRNPGSEDFPTAGPGALVASVIADSPADKAGLKQGDLILSVDGTALDAAHALGDLITAKKVGDVVTLSVISGGQSPAKDVAVTLEKNPNKDGAYLGIEYTMNYPRGFGRGMPGPAAREGALVATVAADGPAAKAGIQSGDIITKVAGVAVTNPQQVADAVAKQKPGDTLVLTVYSRAADKEADILVTLGQSATEASKAFLGVTLRVPMRFGGMPRGQTQPQQNGAGPVPPATL